MANSWGWSLVILRVCCVTRRGCLVVVVIFFRLSLSILMNGCTRVDRLSRNEG